MILTINEYLQEYAKRIRILPDKEENIRKAMCSPRGKTLMDVTDEFAIDVLASYHLTDRLPQDQTEYADAHIRRMIQIWQSYGKDMARVDLEAVSMAIQNYQILLKQTT